MIGIIDSGQKIITNGLVFHLDAAQLRSYPTTGTTWTDLSGGGNNGTLINGPTFNSGNGGSIVFDGVNDYGVITNPSILRNQSFTLSIWCNPAVQTKSIVSMLDFNHAPFQGWVLQSEDANTNRYYYFAWHDGTTFQPVNGLGVGKGIQITNSVWQNIVFTKTGTTLIGYRNGSQVFTPSAATNSNVNYQNNNNLNIATWTADQLRLFGGRISNTQIYNRALSAA